MSRFNKFLNEAMKFKNPATKKYAEDLDGKLLTLVSNTINKFMDDMLRDNEKKLLKMGPSDTLDRLQLGDRDEVLFYASQGMLAYFQGMNRTAKQQLKR